jgi:hypothetical protein
MPQEQLMRWMPLSQSSADLFLPAVCLLLSEFPSLSIFANMLL